MNWQVYIILCSDESLYTGITTDVERRFAQHLAGTGAKYFRGRSPRRLVYLELGHDRSSAGRREAEIKGLRPLDKRRLLAAPDNRVGETACGGEAVAQPSAAVCQLFSETTELSLSLFSSGSLDM